MEKKYVVVASLIVFLTSACSQQYGETTKVATATGGALGAGLGAIVGSQSGSAGGGLVIGALAGSGAGALVGNALEKQEGVISQQQEALERQEKRIAAQGQEINELKRLSQDNLEFDQTASNTWNASEFESRGSLNTASSTYVNKPWNPSAKLQEKDLSATSEDSSRSSHVFKRGSFGDSTNKPTTMTRSDKSRVYRKIGGERVLTQEKKIIEKKTTAIVDNTTLKANYIKKNFNSSECIEAEAEAQSAKIVDEPADRLFHFRRALRLCPENPAYHNGLGEVYLSLKRNEDAEFEFKEALRLDPGYQAAKKNLQNSNFEKRSY